MENKKIGLLFALMFLVSMVPLVFAPPTSCVNIFKSFACGAPTTGLQLYTPYQWLVEITVTNNNPNPITDVVLADRFSGAFGVEILSSTGGSGGSGPVLTYKGATAKVILEWVIGTLGPEESAVILLRVYTDVNPGGQQELTACGIYELNSGAVVKWRDGRPFSASTPPLIVSTT